MSLGRSVTASSPRLSRISISRSTAASSRRSPVLRDPARVRSSTFSACSMCRPAGEVLVQGREANRLDETERAHILGCHCSALSFQFHFLAAGVHGTRQCDAADARTRCSRRRGNGDAGTRKCSWRPLASRSTAINIRGSFPVVSASASPSRAHSPTSRWSCLPTSRQAISTPHRGEQVLTIFQ